VAAVDLSESTPSQTSATLTAVLASPPKSSGALSRGRVALAATTLGFEAFRIVNLFGEETHSTGEITLLGIEQEAWMPARRTIRQALKAADVVLLGYGTSEPSGPALGHHREQVEWLRREMAETGVLRIVTVGGAPRHPSRWHRHTFRTRPGVAFPDALQLEMGSESLSDHLARVRPSLGAAETVRRKKPA